MLRAGTSIPVDLIGFLPRHFRCARDSSGRPRYSSNKEFLDSFGGGKVRWFSAWGCVPGEETVPLGVEVHGYVRQDDRRAGIGNRAVERLISRR